MLTVWGEQLDPAHIREEYPRPQMRRDSYLCLNGAWDYAITPQTVSRCPATFDGQILVPFSPECELSGAERTLDASSCLWYHRLVVLPDGFRKDRLLLHFGAVDCECTVWCNNSVLCSHRGGYYPFVCEIPLETDNVLDLTVRVTDNTERSCDARGKQKTKRGGIWYTPQCGIWQPVWLESVPADYVDALVITPNVDEMSVCLQVKSRATLPCHISTCGQTLSGMSNTDIVIPVPGAALWSPDTPALHDLTVTLGQDRVESYFALRKISFGADDRCIPRLMLNNKPYFHNGILDQGYWSDGMYTAPSDEAMVYDIEAMKALGFNMLRKHIKVEPLRWYYHCDRLGMLVWQDMVSGGGPYRTDVISLPIFTDQHRKDNAYRAFGRASEESRAQYRSEMRYTVETLYNCPCIVVWVPFNEGWGQFDAARICQELQQLDRTRLIDAASGWHDQQCGDIRSWHVYFRPYRFRKDRRGRVAALSEFGGYNLRVQGHCFNSCDFGYKRFPDAGSYVNAVRQLYRNEILPAVEKGLCASVYTQLSDVEDELNGFLTYDRREKKLTELPESTLLSHYFVG